MIESRPNTDELSPTELATEASRMFQGVSKATPGNFVYQSVKTAMDCQERNLNPKDLMDALLKDNTALNQIAHAAEAHHRRSDNKKVPHEVPISEVQRMVKGIFGNAATLMCVPRKRLEKFMHSYGNGDHLNQASNKAERLIRSTRMRESAASKVRSIFQQ